MATVTPNFNWPVPTSTDLVKDGATAIEALGDSIDGSFVDLKGGTTGQILAKASNTDLDYTWTTPNPGDITGVTAGTGITGGGTSGTVTITNDMATTITTNGDLIYGTGSGTYTRRGIGSTGQVLTVSGGVPTWATAGGGGAVVQIADTTLGSPAADITFSSIPSTFNHLMVIISGRTSNTAENGASLSMQLNGDTGANYRGARNTTYASGGSNVTLTAFGAATSMGLGFLWAGKADANYNAAVQITFPNYKLTTIQKNVIFYGGAATDVPGIGTGYLHWQNTAAINSIRIFSSSNLDTGTRATLYGLV